MTTPGSGTHQSTIRRAIEHAVGDVDAVRAGLGPVDDRELLDAVELMMGLQRRVNGTLSVLMAAAEGRDVAMKVTRTPLEATLTRSGQESAGHVRHQAFQATILSSRPKTHDAAAAGTISLDQARAIRDLVEELPTSLSTDQKDQAETLLLAAARRLPARDLRGMTDAVLDEIAPELRDTPEQRRAKLELRDARAARRRCLRFSPPSDGSISFHGSLPIVEGTRFKNMVERVANRAYRAAKDVADRQTLELTPDQRFADALITVANAAEQGVGDSTASSGRMPVGEALITVLIREPDLRDRAVTAGLLTDGTPISASELRRLMCDAQFIPAVLGGQSEILDLGRGRRLASPACRRAVELRDGHCAFPGCAAPVTRCEIHHVIPWQDGGRTSLDNLVALCKRHHGLCEPAPPQTDQNGYAYPPDQWRITMSAHGFPEFTPPRALEPVNEPAVATVPQGKSLHALSLFAKESLLFAKEGLVHESFLAVSARPPTG